MKNLFSLIFIALVCNINAQDLHRYIPKNSNVVVEVSGDKIFSLIEMDDIRNMIPPRPGDQSGKPMDPQEIGIDLKNKAYYFNQSIDSISYNTLVLPVADSKKAETFFTEMFGINPTKINGYQVILQPTTFAAWNDNIAFLSNATIPQVKYTMDDLLKEKEAEKKDRDEDMQGDMDIEEDLESELEWRNLMAPYLYTDEELLAFMKDRIKAISSINTSMSVSQSESFLSGRDENSSVYFWINDLGNLIGKFMSDEIPRDLSFAFSPSLMDSYKSISGNLIFGKNEIKMNTSFEVDAELASIMHKIYQIPKDNPINKYFSGEDALAYMHYQINTTNVLKEYPHLIDNMYGNMFPAYQEEIDIATDLVSILIDEEEIGQLFPGGMTMILHDIEEKEIKYTTYEYDENYESKEVEKTKVETIPIFSLMIGSENKELFDKLIKLTDKYGLLDTPASGFSQINLEASGIPFNLFYNHHDDIVFLSNSVAGMKNLLKPKKQLLMKQLDNPVVDNNFTFYLNIEEGKNKMTKIMPEMNSKLAFADKLKEMKISSGEMKNNKAEIELLIKTKGDHDNALKTILEMIM